uniref:NADH dehydrogenase subunit 6 n=1 Tax=Dendropoma rhyssoconchum TaxID=1434780 RepID=A0A075QRX2_9CAEN|nr:NADH dehydrogenase subunit 6 [Dendropoma rhyssoconchum]
MSAVLICAVVSFISLFLPAMAQPLSLGFNIMCMTVGGCCLCGLFLSSWYGYMLFLVYVGGLLVMFAYVAALIPNVMYKSNYLFLAVASLAFLGVSLVLTSYFMDLGVLTESGVEWSMKYSGGELANEAGMLLVLALILLVTLIAVVKICYFRGGALRSYV